MNRWDTGRIEAFSDGVFAIAITLLVLDLDVPASAYSNLWRGFADQWPAYLGFTTSFVTIGGIWMLHHGIFRRLRYANNVVMRINLVLLMAVSFLPFPTRLVAEAIDSSSAERAAVIIYGASLLGISILFGVAQLRDRARPRAAPAGRERRRRQGAHAGRPAQHRLLRRVHRPCGHRAAGGGVRVPDLVASRRSCEPAATPARPT